MHFGYAENEIGRELRCEKTELSSGHTLLDRKCIQMWESCAQEWHKIEQRVADRVGVACIEVFSWCCAFLLLNCAKR